MKKTYLIIVLMLCIATFAHAEEVALDEPTLAVCNKTMMDIYKDIFSLKDKFPELQYFDSKALSKNQYGIYVISYENKEIKTVRDDNFYKFILTIAGIGERPFKEPYADIISYSYPVLGLKFTGFQTKGFRGKRYNIDSSVQKFGQAIYNHQQKYIPLQLILESDKTIYKTEERIKFKVTLKNNGSQRLKVKNLNEDSLFFTINNKVWGTEPDLAKVGGNEVILNPDRTISRGFVGDSFNIPKEVEIFGTYNMAYKGVLPMGSIKIRIEREEEAP